MSLLSDTRIESPVEKTIKYHGKLGVFVFWDPEKKEEFEIEIKHFIPLAVRTMVTGFCKQAAKGKGSIWSNEIDNMNEQLDVTIGGNLVKSGTWKDIKFEIKAHGGKFTPVVYAAWDGEIIRLLFAGACCGPWIELQKSARKSDKSGVLIAGFTDEVSGEVKFKAPVFRLNAVKPETLEKAVALKGELDQFFIDYARSKANQSTDSELQKESSDPSMNQERNFDDANQELDAVGQEVQKTVPAVTPEPAADSGFVFDPDDEIPF